MLIVVVALLLGAALGDSPWPPSAQQRARALVAPIPVDMLLNMTHGLATGGAWQGTISGLPKYGVPSQHHHDSPQGVAGGFVQVTAFPTAMTVTMTWDVSLARQFGDAMGMEERAKGTSVQLAPAVNHARIPWGGRLFEYLGGEDPTLATALAVQVLLGIQSHNISACVKHYILNEQETFRMNVSSNVDRRTVMELYMPPFEAAVNAGVGSVMCSYNRLNGTFACASSASLIDDLRTRMGFQGWVRSDGHALHSTVEPAMAGNDQEQPRVEFYGAPLTAAVTAGTVPEARIREMVERMLTAHIALGMMTEPPGDPAANATSGAHAALARTIAADGAVLLKNSGGLLPLRASALSSIAVFGDQFVYSGNGSGHVNAPYIISPFAGIYAAANGGVLPPRPANCTFYPDTDFNQPGQDACSPITTQQECCALCASRSDCMAFSYHAGVPCDASSPAGTSRCWIKHSTYGHQASPGVVAGICPPFPTGPSVNVTYAGTDPTTAGAAAAAADVAVVVVAALAAEGEDRPNLSLPLEADALISAVIAANPRTIVALRCPGPCLMPWLSRVPAVLLVGYQGQEGGNALADLIFGAVNPNGKLVHSFPISMNDTWLSVTPGGPIRPESFPGTDRGRGFPEVDYSEGLFTGYRWFDSTGCTPLFEFGFGLSYTTFAYSNFTATVATGPTPVSAWLTVTNSDARPGREVAQLYVGFPPAAGEPPRVLRAFTKTRLLSPGESQLIEWTLPVRALSIFDVTTDAWAAVTGNFTLYAAASSRDLRLTASVMIE